jgi:hypothetical protein
VYKRILLSLSLLAAPLCFGADTAGDYFHRGAQFYIWGKKQEAKNEVITGLKLFPDDTQLNGLAGLLKKEEQQQQQQQQQQQNQHQQQDQQKDQSKQDQNQQQQQSQQDQQKNDSSQQDQQQKQEQQQQKAKPSPDEQKQQQQAAQQAQKSKDDSEQKEGEEAYAAGKMTPEQARQLLDSQKGEEMMLPVKPEGKPTDRRRPVRDW